MSSKWNKFQKQYAGSGLSRQQIAGAYRHQQYGGSSAVEIQYDYGVGDSELINYDTKEQALESAKLHGRTFLAQIDKHKNVNIQTFREKVWDKFFGNDNTLSESKIKADIISYLPGIKLIIGGEVDQVGSREIADYNKNVVKKVLDMLEL